ncbi:MAG: VOC family protein [Ferruginibacter sp.]
METTFAALADGGNITMPMQDTFWGARFGMTTDKFGVHWMFNHDKEKK